MNKRIAVVTDFYSVDPAYSLCNVAGNQIKMLLRAGYSPVVIVDEKFTGSDIYPWQPGLVEFRHLASVPRDNRIEVNDMWVDDIDRMEGMMREALSGIDIALTHDLIYQNCMIKHRIAARRIARERDDLAWLHLIHSATPIGGNLTNLHPTAEILGEPFPKSRILYPNEYDRKRVADNYSVPVERVEHVPHAIDIPGYFGFHEITRKLADDIDLFSADVIGCYPARLDRGKQVEIGIEIFSELAERGFNVRYIVIDFHSTGGDKVRYRKSLKRLARNLGLASDVVFTSEMYPETRVGCPRQVVRDIYAVSDVYIHPSRSETYSLTTQEAGIFGNVLVLNADFPAMRTIFGSDAIFGKFSSNMDILADAEGSTETKYDDRKGYMTEMARQITSELLSSSALRQKRRIRRTRNLDAVFTQYLEPLFYKETP